MASSGKEWESHPSVIDEEYGSRAITCVADMLGCVDTLLLGNMAPPTSVSPGFLSVSYPDYNTKYKHPLGTRPLAGVRCMGSVFWQV